jgi:uncharacterized protein (TIGR02391 family)
MIPDVDYLLSLEAEELASYVLVALSAQRQNGLVHPSNFTSGVVGLSAPASYSDPRRDEIILAVTEALNWLEVQGLLVPAPGMNGVHGFRVFSRRANKMQSPDDIRQFARSRRIQKETLHPKIAQTVWSAFMRGEYDTAVFQAMKAVEVRVREASNLSPGDIGVPLMRTAFNSKTGILTDQSAEFSEREARANLFAGAIGSYKNAQSHRDVNLQDPEEAYEIVMFANHLLRIVDQRAPK